MNRLHKIAYELTKQDKVLIQRALRELSEYTDDAVRIMSMKINRMKNKSTEKRASVIEDVKKRVDEIKEHIPKNPSLRAKALRNIVEHAEDAVRGQEKKANLARGRKLLQARINSGKLSGVELQRNQRVLNALDPKNIKKVAPDARSTADVVRKVLPAKTYEYPYNFGEIARRESAVINAPEGLRPKYLKGTLDKNLDNYYKGHQPLKRDRVPNYDTGGKSPHSTSRVTDAADQFLAHNTISEANPKPKLKPVAEKVVETVPAKTPQPVLNKLRSMSERAFASFNIQKQKYAH